MDDFDDPWGWYIIPEGVKSTLSHLDEGDSTMAKYNIGDIVTLDDDDTNEEGPWEIIRSHPTSDYYRGRDLSDGIEGVFTEGEIVGHYKKEVSVRELSWVEKQRQQMIQSYANSIREAGGDPTMFLDSIDTMTVAEMIEGLAQNRVRFTTLPKPPEQRKYSSGEAY